MAIKATIYKVLLQVTDLDRHYYAEHALTLARHPSETDERMMVRLLTFGLYADDALTFGKGISNDDEPDLWQKDLTGNIEKWIEIGLPDERSIRKASGRAKHVIVVSYGRSAHLWWNDSQDKLLRFNNLTILQFPVESTLSLASIAHRSMHLQCIIQDGNIMITSGADMIQLQPLVLQRSIHTSS